MARSIPSVEISHDGDFHSIGRPDRKVGSGLTPRIQDVGAELLVESKMTPFVKKIGVVSGEERYVRANLLYFCTVLHSSPDLLIFFLSPYPFFHHRLRKKFTSFRV